MIPFISKMILIDLWNFLKKWLLEFNEGKCHVLSLGKVENIIHAHNYKMNGVKLEHVFEEKDLGITLIVSYDLVNTLLQKLKKQTRWLELYVEASPT